MNVKRMMHFSLLAILLSVWSAQAQYEKGSAVFMVSGGGQFMDAEDTDSSLDGFSGSFSYERSSWDGKWSGGFSLSYLSSQGTAENGTTVNFETVPLMLFAKFNFGNSTKLRGFLRGGVGAHSSQIERSGEAVVISDWDTGYLLGAGLGGNYYMSKDLLLSLSYNFSYLDNSFYRDGLIHLIQLGMGFQFD